MPYKKKYVRRRRKTGKRKARFTNTSIQLTGIQSILPTTFKTKLVYYDSVALNPSFTAVASHTYSANGMFDPNITGVGHQPRGWDQLMSMYDHAIVIGSKITVLFSNSNNTNPVTGFVRIADANVTSTTPADWYEDGYVRKCVVQSSNGSGTGRLTHGVSPIKFLGGKMGDDSLKNDVTSNPGEQCYFQVGVTSLDPGIDLADVEINVIIEYICVLIEPKRPTIS